MSRQITSRTSLENLKREAKRWLKAIEAGDTEARDRFRSAHPNPPAAPGLRDVQHALAREYGVAGWVELKTRVEGGRREEDRSDTVQWFIENACPDHHVRGPSDHNEARHIALRILRDNPWLPDHSFGTAVICGNIERVRRALADDPTLATRPIDQGNPQRGNSGGGWDKIKYKSLGPKGWEPLLHLAFTRLPIQPVTDNAVAIATLLLDNGANPNAWFKAGGSHYTPLTGVVGEGEEDRPPHQKRDELCRLLLDRGADPYDEQVLYDIHFHGNVLWWFELMHEYSLKLGRGADWDDPTWSKLPMGVYGPGASFWFAIAARHNNIALARWMLAHGAKPDTRPFDPKHWSGSAYEEALRHGNTELAALLEAHGGGSGVTASETGLFISAAMRLDRDTLLRMVGRNPGLLKRTDALFAAVRSDRRDVAELLLDLGTSPDVENDKKERPLHIAGYTNAVKVAELLIERGAQIDPIELNFNNTPIDGATYMQAKEMIELLGRHSRDVFYLTYNGRVERVRELLAEDPELLRKTKNVGELLMWLPPDDEQAAAELARVLIAHGARPAGTNAGLTTADYIEKLGLHEAAEIIRTADPSLRSG